MIHGGLRETDKRIMKRQVELLPLSWRDLLNLGSDSPSMVMFDRNFRK